MLFLEVDPEDVNRIYQEFPQATVVRTPRTGDALVETCRNAEVVSTFIYSQWSRTVVARLPRLRLLCTRSVGFNHIDTAACQEQDIAVCNVPDYGSHVIAEHVFALLLSTLRHIHEGSVRVVQGIFDYHGLRGVALQGKTIGIVGTGNIGRRVARIAHGFGMNILGVDQCRTVELENLGLQYVAFDELLRKSDIVSLHLPLTEETRHIINARAFQQMKDGVILVNTARGELIDSVALLHALQTKKVGHALLDVLEHEQNFAENAELLKHPSVVATPHIAFYVDDSMRNMYTDCFQSIHEFVAGKTPEHIVQPLKVICDLPLLKRNHA